MARACFCAAARALQNHMASKRWGKISTNIRASCSAVMGDCSNTIRGSSPLLVREVTSEKRTDGHGRSALEDAFALGHKGESRAAHQLRLGLVIELDDSLVLLC